MEFIDDQMAGNFPGYLFQPFYRKEYIQGA
jgi:hypothetical protein